MIYLADPNVASLLMAVEKAVDDLKHSRRMSALKMNECVRNLYNWRDVTRRNVAVYDRIARLPRKSLARQLRRYIPTGVLPWLLVVTLCHVLLMFLQWFVPETVKF